MLSLANADAYDEAMTIADGLLQAADATQNPQIKALALNAYAWAHRGADPAAAYEIFRRAMKIAHDSGNRSVGHRSVRLSRLAASHGDPIEALDYMVSAARGYQDTGSFLLITGTMAMIAILFDRLGHYETAAMIIGIRRRAGFRLVFPRSIR